MKATVLVDNIKSEDLKGEWGLSIFIEVGEKKILLDTGASSRFLENAKKLNIDVSSIDYAVLSHAHYDHADGMEPFFLNNTKAKFYIREEAGENCYFKKWIFKKYIGIPKHILDKYENRMERVQGVFELFEDVYLVPHYTKNRELIGKRNHMYVKKGDAWYPDDFAHEQSIVIDTKDGLIVFNSCSHTGVDNIIEEVSQHFHKNVSMMIGGFHIFKESRQTVIELSNRLKQTGVKEIYTGHCTGETSYKILKENLGDSIFQLKTGLTIEF